MRALTKSELIDKVFARHGSLTNREADEAVNEILKTIISAMSHGVRVEVRGFGSFSLKHRAARTAATPGRVPPSKSRPNLFRTSVQAKKSVTR